MQRLRQSVLLQLLRQVQVAPALSPLPGLQQLAAPTHFALTAILPAARHNTVPCTSLVSSRSFAAAADPCRFDDQQSAAEALFTVSTENPQVFQEPAVYPFFARAYYVGEHRTRSMVKFDCIPTPY